jgi:hypothetical protein
VFVQSVSAAHSVQVCVVVLQIGFRVAEQFALPRHCTQVPLPVSQ